MSPSTTTAGRRLILIVWMLTAAVFAGMNPAVAEGAPTSTQPTLTSTASAASAAPAPSSALTPDSAQGRAGTSGAVVIGVTHGAGIMTKNGTWFGQWLNKGRAGYCIDPNMNVVSMPWWTSPAVAGLTSAQVARLSYIVTTYGNTKDNARAASVRLAALLIVAPNSTAVKRGLDAKSGLPAAVVASARAMVAASTKLAGPYKVTVTVTKAALPGGTGTASVVVRSASGTPVPATLQLSATNARLAASSVSTGAGGQAATVTFTRSDAPAPVTLRASAQLAAASVLITRPSAGFQRLVSWAPKTAVVGGATYQQTFGAPTITYSCVQDCTGTPPVTVRACNAASGPVTYVVRDNGRDAARFTVAAGQCGTTSVAVADGHTVTSAWQLGANAPTAFDGRLLVDCPPAPLIRANVDFSCTAGNVRLSLPKNTTERVQRLTVDGQVRQTVQPGQELPPYVLSVPCGRNTTVAFQSSIQRANGTWNAGLVGKIVVP